MGLLGVYRRHIKKFAQTAKPIYDLLSLDLWKKKNVTSTKHSPKGKQWANIIFITSGVGDPAPVSIRGLNRSHNVTPCAGVPRLRCSIYSTYWCVTGWPRCGFVPRTEWLYTSNRLRIKNPDSIRTQLSYAFRQAGIPSSWNGQWQNSSGITSTRPLNLWYTQTTIP